MTDQWVGLPSDGAASLRLLCFGHAGSGAAFFRPWRDALLPDVEVCPVLLPGRESRITDRPFRAMEDLLDPLVEGLFPQLDRPYAIFGHSVGAAIGYEVARRLVDEPGRAPVGLLVSGRRAPQIPLDTPQRHLSDDTSFLNSIADMGGTPPEILRRLDLMRLFMPTLRADFQLNETYRWRPGPPLPCPIVALTGDQDTQVSVVQMRGWQLLTCGGFSLRVFPGDHFYLAGPRPDVAAALRADLRRLAEPALRTGLRGP